jgi:hypothetical protein
MPIVYLTNFNPLTRDIRFDASTRWQRTLCCAYAGNQVLRFKSQTYIYAHKLEPFKSQVLLLQMINAYRLRSGLHKTHAISAYAAVIWQLVNMLDLESALDFSYQKNDNRGYLKNTLPFNLPILRY